MGVGYITKSFLRDIKQELNIMGEKTRPLSAIKNLNLETLRSQFNNLLNLARLDYKEKVNNEDAKLPREYFDTLRRSFAEQLLSAENLNPYSGEDWSTIARKTASQYDLRIDDLIKKSKDSEKVSVAEQKSEDEERRKEENSSATFHNKYNATRGFKKVRLYLKENNVCCTRLV